MTQAAAPANSSSGRARSAWPRHSAPAALKLDPARFGEVRADRFERRLARRPVIEVRLATEFQIETDLPWISAAQPTHGPECEMLKSAPPGDRSRGLPCCGKASCAGVTCGR